MGLDLSFGRFVKVYFKNSNRVEIRDLKNEEMLFKGYGIKWLDLNESGSKVVIWYQNCKGEIRDLKGKTYRGNLIFKGHNIEKIYFDSTGSKAVIWYKNREINVVDFKI